MMQPADLARELLTLAERDIVEYRLLAASPLAADATVGFHGQQAVEKCLKAVLALNAVAYGRTHDIFQLVAYLQSHGCPMPPHAADLPQLSPFAVMGRYDSLLPVSLDRARWQSVIDDIMQWAQALLP